MRMVDSYELNIFSPNKPHTSIKIIFNNDIFIQAFLCQHKLNFDAEYMSYKKHKPSPIDGLCTLHPITLYDEINKEEKHVLSTDGILRSCASYILNQFYDDLVAIDWDITNTFFNVEIFQVVGHYINDIPMLTLPFETPHQYTNPSIIEDIESDREYITNEIFNAFTNSDDNDQCKMTVRSYFEGFKNLINEIRNGGI